MHEWMNDCLKPELSVHLSDCNFVVQRLLLGLGVLTYKLRCNVHSIVCYTCVGLRFDMPLIKPILIDWLIDWLLWHSWCNFYNFIYQLKQEWTLYNQFTSRLDDVTNASHCTSRNATATVLSAGEDESGPPLHGVVLIEVIVCNLSHVGVPRLNVPLNTL